MKQIQINIPFILQLITKYHEKNCQDKTIIAQIQKAIGSSPDLRDKRQLIMDFIEMMTPKADGNVVDDWDEYVELQRDAELSNIIREEGLKAKETRAFMNQSLADGYVTTTGVAITKVLPPMPVFGKGAGNREQKKRTVLEKLTAFFNKYLALTAAPIASEQLRPLKLEHVEADQDVRNLVFSRLAMNAETTDYELQREAMEAFGERYPDMSLNDWRHIIEDYTPMIRNANKAREIPLQPRHLDMAAEGGIRQEQSGIIDDDL